MGSVRSAVAAAVLGHELRIVEEIGLTHDAVVGKLHDVPLRQRVSGNAHRVGPDVPLEIAEALRLPRGAEKVVHFFPRGLAADDLRDVVLREPLLERDEPAVGADARRVADMPPRQLRIPVDSLAVRERLALGWLAHDRLHLALARLARHEPAAIEARP